MLSGTYIYGMDRKGRLVLPSEFRDALGAPVLLTRGPEQFLYAFAHDQWQVLTERFAYSLQFRVRYLAHAKRCPVDPPTGRILIPHELREWSGLRAMEEVAVTGLGQVVQIGLRSRWEAANEDFPALQQLEIDLRVPTRASSAPYAQRVEYHAGLPLITCRGKVHKLALTRLTGLVGGLAADGFRALILDVQESADPRLLLATVRRQISGKRPEVWAVTPLRVKGVRSFADWGALFRALPAQTTGVRDAATFSASAFGTDGDQDSTGGAESGRGRSTRPVTTACVGGAA